MADQSIFRVEYLGIVPVNVSTKLYSFEDKKGLINECITKLLDFKSGNYKPGKFQQHLGPAETNNSGSYELLFTDETVILQQNQEFFSEHDLLLVSFVATGMKDLIRYFGYITKIQDDERVCLVFESDQITSPQILKCFAAKFEELSKKSNPNKSESIPALPPRIRAPNNFKDQHIFDNEANEDGNNFGCLIPEKISYSKNSSKNNLQVQDEIISELFTQPWYRGRIDRKEAEKKLIKDGQFLVRDSLKQNNQFILSGKDNGKFVHLLLVDSEGKIRSSTREFRKIEDLVNYHIQTGLAINSVDNTIRLLSPIID